jgi:hypothetical protein
MAAVLLVLWVVVVVLSYKLSVRLLDKHDLL